MRKVLVVMCWLGALLGSRHARAADPVPTGIGPEGGSSPESAPPSGEERSALDDWSIIPILFYTPETSLGFGAAVVWSFDPTDGKAPISTIGGGLILTTEEQVIFRIEPDVRLESFILHSFVRLQRYPTRYFEDGAHPGDDGEPYDEASLLASVDGRFRIDNELAAGLRCDMLWDEVLDTQDGGVLDGADVLGKRPYVASGCGPVIAYDTRNDVRLPSRGIYAEARLQGWTSLYGESFHALQSDLDFRGFVDLGHGHVFAGHLRLRATLGDLPFQLLPKLGGSNFLRGWFEGHLLSQNAALAQLEWRFPLFWKISGAVFASAGQAFERFEDFSPDELRFGAGAGLRVLVNKRQSVNVRVDFAYGSNFAAYVDVLEAF